MIPFQASFLSLSLLLLFARTAWTQDVPELQEHQKSVVLFDIKLEELFNDIQALGVTRKDFGDMDIEFVKDINVSEVKRVFGSASFPKSLDSVATIRPNSEFPAEFFVRFQFQNLMANRKLLREFDEDSDEGGAKNFRTAKGGFKRVVGYEVNETSFEIGTIDYCLQPSRNFHSAKLAQVYKAMPKAPVQIVVDLQSRPEFIKEVRDALKNMVGGPTLALLELIDKVDSIFIACDPGGSTLLQIVAEGKDEQQAEELREGLDPMLGIVKLTVKAELAKLASEAPKTVPVFTQLNESLKATREGNKVKIIVSSPEGMETAVSEFLEIAKAKARSKQQRQRFRQIGVAVHNYHAVYREFPFIATRGQSNDLSWRVRILPYLEHAEMYGKMDMKKGHQEQPNSEFAAKMPSIFGSNDRLSTVSWIDTGVGGMEDVADGTSNTIMLIEYPKGQPWLTPDSISPDEAVRLVSSLKDDESLRVVFYDGSCYQIGSQTDQETLKKLFTHNGKEIVDRKAWGLTR